MAFAAQKQQAWKQQAYPVPIPSRTGLRWKASILSTLKRWNGRTASARPATIMVPALYNIMPAEGVAMGWFNEIDALVTMRQRMSWAAQITGWDVFTFHTQHNADDFFDTTISAVRDTWLNEGTLSAAAVKEARRLFGKPHQYHRIHARFVENLVFQSSLMDWVTAHASGAPLRFHVIGTALLSALVSSQSITFAAAVESAARIGSRWDEAVCGMTNETEEDAIGWSEFRQVRQIMNGQSKLSLAASIEDLPVPDAPARPFWYSVDVNSEPMLITTAQDAAAALETMNLNSWACVPPGRSDDAEEPVRGWLVSPLNPIARHCRWSISNYLLATPASVTLFLDHIAALGSVIWPQPVADPIQNRLRLSRMKVTGP